MGFNRRYAPLVEEMKKHLHLLRGPRVIQIRVNAGFLAANHWTQDPEVGGGRLVGEGCHFVDLISFLAESDITHVNVDSVPSSAGLAPVSDNFALNLKLSDGSVGTLTYTSLGDPSLAKERVEVHASGCSMVLDDFRELHVHKSGKSRKISRRKDKGVQREVRNLLAALRGEVNELITWEEIQSVTSWTLRAQDLLRERR